MPVGAYGGRREIMQHIAPLGLVYQGGTLSGNPIAMTAGLVTLDEIAGAGVYEKLTRLTEQLLAGLQACASENGIPFTTNHVGSMFGLFFSKEPSITHYSQAVSCNFAHFKQFFHGMLARGIYLAPSAYEAGFISIMHGPKEIAATVDAAKQVFASMK